MLARGEVEVEVEVEGSALIQLRLFRFACLLSLFALVCSGPSSARDAWVHPRNEPFDSEKHYRDGTGEIYYRAENDIETSLGRIVVKGGDRPVITVELGADLFDVTERANGSLRPVLLYDSNGDGRVDRTIRGRVEGRVAVFDSPRLAEFSLRRTRWQIGVQYDAGEDGDAGLDRRYLASVDSSTAVVEGLPAVGTGSFVPALLISKHREGIPFDLADFRSNPARYAEDFDPLTREADGDDWTADGPDGRLVTHFEEEDLFLVRTARGFQLDVEWGDVPLAAFMEQELLAPLNGDGCYSSLDHGLSNGTPVVVPHRLVYCPKTSLVLFDAPDGYEIGLSALRGDELYERTEAGTSTADNLRLYVKEIYPRSPSRRATGSVTGNIRAGFSDARRDLGDALHYALIGTEQQSIHTGARGYKPSPITALPLAAVELLRLHPLRSLSTLLDGADSAVLAGASLVSAVDNTAVTTLLQASVGNVASTESADAIGDVVGAVTQSAVKNLPFSERSTAAISPFDAWNHDRAFAPTSYTRTDTQLNIDRVVTFIDLSAISAIERHNDDSGAGGVQDGGENPRGPHPEPEPPGAGPHGPKPPRIKPVHHTKEHFKLHAHRNRSGKFKLKVSSKTEAGKVKVTSSSPDALDIPEVTDSTDSFLLKAKSKFHKTTKPNGSVRVKESLKVKASKDTPPSLTEAALADLKGLVKRVIEALR